MDKRCKVIDNLWAFTKEQQETIDELKKQNEGYCEEIKMLRDRVKVEAAKKMEWKTAAWARTQAPDPPAKNDQTWDRPHQRKSQWNPEYKSANVQHPSWMTKWTPKAWIDHFEATFTHPQCDRRIAQQWTSAKKKFEYKVLETWYHNWEDQKEEIGQKLKELAQDAFKFKPDAVPFVPVADGSHEPDRTDIVIYVQPLVLDAQPELLEGLPLEVLLQDAKNDTQPDDKPVLDLFAKNKLPCTEHYVEPKEISFNAAALLQAKIQEIQEQYCEDEGEDEEQASEIYQELWDELNKENCTLLYDDIEYYCEKLQNAKSNCSRQREFLTDLLNTINQSKNKNLKPIKQMQ